MHNINDLRLGDLPQRAARRWPDRPALQHRDQTWTHAEFARDVDRVAKGLMAIGVESGDHVGVWMVNRPEWLWLMYAVGKVGACLVPLNTRYRSDDMAFTVINSETKVLVSIDVSGPIDYRSMLADARPEIEAAGHLQQVVMLNGQLDDSTGWDQMIEAGTTISDEALGARASGVDPDQLMLLAYTSGTTGHPKGVMHSHRPLISIRERAMLLGHSQNDVHLNFLPMFHIYALSEIAAMVPFSGGSQVLFEAFDPDAALDAIETNSATVLHGFDSHWRDLLLAQAASPRDVSSLRVGSLPAGMESTTPIAREAQDALCPTISGFGMSECWSFICCSHPTHTLEQRIEASGYPMEGVEIEIRDDESGRVLADGQQGKLYIRNFTNTRGYWANPEATAAVLSDDGWLDTGDIALMRPDGHVVFLGRHKDMLKVGGENVSPAEVEGYLREDPGVVDAAVVGYPDDRLAEVPVAYVVRSKDDADAPLPTEEKLIEGLRGRIASYKIPRAVIFVDEMPSTPSGKIRKVELRARALVDLA